MAFARAAAVFGLALGQTEPRRTQSGSTVTGEFIDDYVSLAIAAGTGTDRVTASAEAWNDEELEGLYAGLDIVAVEIAVPRDGVTGGPYRYEIRDEQTPLLKILHAYKSDGVTEVLREDAALDGACLLDSDDSMQATGNIVGEPWASAGAPLFENIISTLQAVDPDDTSEIPAAQQLTFKMGGVYKSCFTTDSSWDNGKVDVPNILWYVNGIYSNCQDADCLELKRYDCYSLQKRHNSNNSCVVDYSGDVNGIYSNCQDADCLELKRYDCYSLQKRHNSNNSCVVDYSGDGNGYQGTLGKLSWSEDYNGTYDEHGNVTMVQPMTCKTSLTPSEILCDKGEDCDGSSDRILPLLDAGGTGKVTKSLPQVVDTLYGGSFRAYSIKVCYCPNYMDSKSVNPCDSSAEFIQGVGTLHIWAILVCLHTDEACSLSSYEGVVPQTKFTFKVLCPGDVCPPTQESRLRIVDVDPMATELPSWDAHHNCHSPRDSLAVVHPCSVPAETPDITNVVPTPAPTPADCVLTGGRRQDYKIFGKTRVADDSMYKMVDAYLPAIGESYHERLNYGKSKDLDVCFCDKDCHSPSNYFKVGQLRVVPFRPVKAIGPSNYVEYTNRPGVIGFVNEPQDALISGAQEGGIMKLLRTPDAYAPVPETPMYQALTDHDCATHPYDTALVPELNEETAWTTYRALLQSQENNSVLGFNYYNKSSPVDSVRIPHNLTFTQPGLIAVCYCTEVYGEEFEGTEQYGTCREPLINWKLALLFTLKGGSPGHYWEYSTNVIFALDVKGWGMTSDHTVRVLEPGGDCEVPDGNPNLVVPTMYKGCPHACSAFSSNPGNEPNIALKTMAWDAVNCNEQNRNCEVSFIRKVTVLSAFETEIQFTAAPGLREGDRIVLTDNYLCRTCTEDQLLALKGEFSFAEDDDAPMHFASQYVVGHLVTPSPNGDPSFFRINIGWSTLPRIEVIEDGADFGKWKLINRARSAQELKGTRAKFGLKVCWSPQGTGYYSSQIGTLTLVDPNVMEQPIIAFSSRMLGNRAPIIISFKTASASVGERYRAKTTEPMLLRLHFLNRNFLEVYLSDLEQSDLEEVNAGEDELREAAQYICGKLFKEMWSTDKKNGFPLPKGCFFTTVGRQRDLVIVFEPESGLAPGQSYQLVVHAAGKLGIEKDGEYLQIFTMDEVYSKPFSAIEMGRAQLLRVPLEPAGAADPQFLYPTGLNLINDEDGVLDMERGSLMFELMGHETSMAAIIPRTIFRIFLWPLTMWETPSCDVTCTGYQDLPCGDMPSCKTEPVGVFGQQNLLIFDMPAELPPIFDDVKHTFEVKGLTMPKGGFFPNRLAAEVSRPLTDTKPHYTQSVGAMLMKYPDEGYAVAKLLNSAGDGNTDPFREADVNTLYLRVILGATLYGGGSAYPVASFTIGFPTGYEVISMGEADRGLRFFEDRPPGRGTLGNPENWVCCPDPNEPLCEYYRDRTCSYTIKSHEILYVGSSIMIKATVRNPGSAIPQESIDNAWTLSTNSKGLNFASARGYSTPEIQFFATSAEYSAATSVLGIFSESSFQSFNPAFSIPGTAQQSLLAIYFHIDVTTMLGARLLVHAPLGYHFGRLCTTQDLPGAYVTNDFGSVHPLPRVVRCIGHVSDLPRPNLVNVQARTDESTKCNQAVIDTSLRLLADTAYAFGVNVINPLQPIADEDNLWYLWALTPTGAYVAGTPEPMPTNPYSGDRVQLYHRTLFTMESPSREGIIQYGVRIDNPRPYTLSGVASVVTFFPIILPVMEEGGATSFNATLRITAPLGIEFTDLDFLWCAPEEVSRSNETCKALVNISNEHVGEDGNLDWMLDWYDQSSIGYKWSHFPGGYPNETRGNILTFNEGQYLTETLYAFQIPINVPDYNPSMSWNKFTIEFAFDNPDGGLYFGQMEADRVGSIRNFRIEPDQQTQDGESDVTVTFDLATAIPEGGGLTMTAPIGFRLTPGTTRREIPVFVPMQPSTVDTSMPVPIYEAEADFTVPVDTRLVPLNVSQITEMIQSPLLKLQLQEDVDAIRRLGMTIPASTQCIYDAKAPGNPQMDCVVGEGGMLAGLYSFKMRIKHPPTFYQNGPQLNTPCGYRDCWTLRTTDDVITGKDLDLNSTFIGYHILNKMNGAKLMSVASFPNTGRNDRPGRVNNVIISFSLNQDAQFDDIMKLEAPYGYMFAENCFFGLEYRPDNIFGDGVPLPGDFNRWDEESAILDCKALNNVAELSIRRGLKKELTYAFRIRMEMNAFRQPAVNKWRLTFNGESATPFDGFPLWMMTNTRVRPSTSAKNLNEEEALSLGLDTLDTKNPVAIFFTPSRTVSRNIPEDSGAYIRVVAPKAYRMMVPCEVQLVQEEFLKPAEVLGKPSTFYPFEVWRGSDLTCFERDTNVVDVRINVPEKELVAGNPYQVVVTVFNPSVVQDISGIWNVQTYSQDAATFEAALDEVTIDGFNINRALALWQYRNTDTDGYPQVYGQMPVDGMLLMMKFPDRLDILDTVLIQAPTGFNLADDSAPAGADGLFPCDNWRWEMIGKARPFVSVPRCKGNMLKLVIDELAPVPPMTMMKLLIDTVNPAVTPVTAENLWTCAHFRVDRVSNEITTMSSHTNPSWEIVSQLENVQIIMNGPDYGASGTGSIIVRFTPMSVANRVLVHAKDPPDFDFRKSGLILQGQEVIKVEKEHILMRIMLNSLVPVEILIVDVILGYPGGPTEFDITTFAEDIKVDEKLRFDGGFVLPGYVHIDAARFESNYTRRPKMNPIEAQWAVQLSSSMYEIQNDPELEELRVARPQICFSNLHIKFSRPAAYNDTFLFKVFPFFLVGDEFSLTFLDTGKPVRMDYYIEESDTPDPENGRRRYLRVRDTLKGTILEPQGIPAFTLLELNVDLYSPDADKFEELNNDGTKKWPLGWRLETQAEYPVKAQYPSNTNDGHYKDFILVREFGFRIKAGSCLDCRIHAPPGADIVVATQVESFQTRPTEIYMIAPIGFEYLLDADTGQCIYAGDGARDITFCEVYDVKFEFFNSNDESLGTFTMQTIRLDAEQGLRPSAGEMTTEVRTPFGTPKNPSWYVDGWRRDSFMETYGQVGWRKNVAGFEVMQMQNSRVLLPVVPGQRVPVAFGYSSRDRLDRRSQVEVIFPPNYIPMCETFKSLSLPGEPGCTIIQDSPDYVETLMYRVIIQVNLTMVVADYSFMMELLLPPMTPDDNMFSMILRDQFGETKDAAMNMPIGDMLFGAPITAHGTCYWEVLPGCLRYCEIRKMVTFVWNIDEVLGENIKIKHIMIFFPDNVEHEIEPDDNGRPSNNAQLIKVSFPHTKMYPDKRNMFGFDVAESHWSPKPGEYEITIPLLLPEYPPGFNVWTISLCSEGGEARCQSLKDTDPPGTKPHERLTLLRFPIPGFGITDESPSRGEEEAGAFECGFAALFFTFFLSNSWVA